MTGGVVTYSMDTMDTAMICFLGKAREFHHASQNGSYVKSYELCAFWNLALNNFGLSLTVGIELKRKVTDERISVVIHGCGSCFQRAGYLILRFFSVVCLPPLTLIVASFAVTVS